MRMRTLVCASLLVPVLALAQPKTAEEWYKEGSTQYNLGNFDKAADAFKEGFAVETVDSKKPAYLYNVAQAYRQGGKCKDAAFFYKRYLSLKDQDSAKPLSAQKRAETEQFISYMEACAKNLEANAKKPPDSTISPDGTGSGSTATRPDTTPEAGAGSGSGTTVADSGDGSDGSDDDDDGGETAVSKTVFPAPKVLSARFVGGAAKISAGDLDVPVQASFGLIGGYPVFVQDKLEIDAGAAVTYTPVPFQNIMTMAQKNASFTTLLADAGATYLVAPRIGLRADVGVGVLVFGGITEAGNPFTDMGAPTSGALTMLAVRGAVSADVAITPNVYATVAPFAFTYSPAKSGLRTDIKSITRMDFMVGVGYRM
jgi:hypothetical protein